MRGFIAGACVNLGTRSCPFFVGFSAGFLYRRPGGGFFARCRSARPQGVLLGLSLLIFLARMAPTECREAPPARRKGSSLLLPSQLQLSSAERHPRATAGIGNRSNNRELFDRFPPARGPCRLQPAGPVRLRRNPARHALKAIQLFRTWRNRMNRQGARLTECWGQIPPARDCWSRKSTKQPRVV
jgi:hypothetical protein